MLRSYRTGSTSQSSRPGHIWLPAELVMLVVLGIHQGVCVDLCMHSAAYTYDNNWQTER